MNLPSMDYLKSQAAKIHWFGLGFVQIKMKNPSERFHFYTDKFEKTADEEDIHTHRKPFQSSILKGALSQYIFKVQRWVNREKGSPYVHSFESCGHETLHQDTLYPRGVDVKHLHSSYYAAGSQYDLMPDVFHRVSSTNAITHIQLGKEATVYAEVVRRRGATKICPFSVAVPENQLWEFVSESLRDG